MFDKSILFAKKALEIQPNNPIVYNNLCVSYIGANKIDEAISAGEMAIKLDPNSFLAKANLDWAKSLKK
jgi:tetratricopeptide (TPR) repeat protein